MRAWFGVWLGGRNGARVEVRHRVRGGARPGQATPRRRSGSHTDRDADPSTERGAGPDEGPGAGPDEGRCAVRDAGTHAGPGACHRADRGAVLYAGTYSGRTGAGSVRVAAGRTGAAGLRGAAGAAALAVLLSSCGAYELAPPEDAEPRDDPAGTVPGEPEAGPDPTLVDRALWGAPFSAPPEAAGTGFVGPALPEHGLGDLRFLGVDADGTTRWSTTRNPTCTAFTVTRDDSGRDLVVLLDSDADPDRGALATTTTAAALDPDDGSLVWGPTEVPGTLVGPGLVFAAVAGTVVGGPTGPETALDPTTGEVTASEDEEGGEAGGEAGNESHEDGNEDDSVGDEDRRGGNEAGGGGEGDSEEGGLTVHHEHQGVLLVEEEGLLRARDTGTGRELWTGDELSAPERAEPPQEGGRATYGPPPRNGTAGAAVLAWTGADGETAAHTVHDLRTGERLAEFAGPGEPRAVGHREGFTAVLGPHPDGGGQLLVGLDTAGPQALWREELPEDGTGLEAVLGDRLHLTDGDTTRVLDAGSGDVLGEGEWAVPAALAEDGTALLPVESEGVGDTFAAYASDR